MQDFAPEAFEALHVKPRAGRTLICGSFVTPGKVDRRMRYPDAVGVDMRAGMGVDVVADLEEPQPQLGQFDHVECCSVLEHSRRPWLLAEQLQERMSVGATLHVSAPFIWREHQHPADYYRFTLDGIRVLFPRIEWRVLMYGAEKLVHGEKTPGTKIEGFPFYARCESFGFGVRV